jgi:hypothetical protein
MKYLSVCSLTALLAAIILSAGCSNSFKNLFPEYLENTSADGAGARENHLRGGEAEALLKNDSVLKPLIIEFKPVKTEAALYKYNGITIIMAIASFESADDAFGFFSWITIQGRELLEGDQLTITTKLPFTAGLRGKHVALFYSPSNPGNYFAFYRDHLFSALKNFPNEDNLQFHSRFLPEANMVLGSRFYVREREVNGVPVASAHGAVYQTGRERSMVFIEKGTSEQAVIEQHTFIAAQFLVPVYTLQNYVYASGGPGTGFYWVDDGKFNLLYRYKWVSVYMTGLPDMRYSQQILRGIYSKMVEYRRDTAKDAPKRKIFREQEKHR